MNIKLYFFCNRKYYFQVPILTQAQNNSIKVLKCCELVHNLHCYIPSCCLSDFL